MVIKKFPIFVIFGLVLFFAFSYFFIGNSARAASAPMIITYQGKLLVSNYLATTTQNIYFILYDSLSGGTALYSASGTIGTPNFVNVTPNQGLFSINLGDTGTNAITSTIFRDNASVFLEVRIGADTLTPRKRITSVPYSFNSKFLDGVPGDTLSTTTYIPISDSSGNFRFNSTTISTSTITSATIISSTIGVANIITSTISALTISSTLYNTTGQIFFGPTLFPGVFGTTLDVSRVVSTTGAASQYASLNTINLKSTPAAGTSFAALYGYSQVPNTNSADMTNSATGTSLVGTQGEASFAGTGGIHKTIGLYGLASNDGAGIVEQASGLESSAILRGSGNIASMFGLRVINSLTGSGSATNSYGIHISNPSDTGGGSILTNYGIYLADMTAGTTDYSIYSDGGQSYHGGNFGIGDTSPSSTLTVGNGDLFQVDFNGNIIKIMNVTYSWPSSQGASSTILQNNGSGVLSWVATSTLGISGYSSWTLASTSADTGYSVTSGVSAIFAGINGVSTTRSNNTLNIGLVTSGATADTYGSASTTPTLTVDAYGRITAISTSSISLSASQIAFGTLAIARGGTNSSSVGSAGSVAYSDGTSYMFTQAGSLGQLLQSAGTGVPVWVSTSSLGISQWTTSGSNIYYVGGVGINTTSVSATLFVAGSSGTTPFTIVSSTGSTMLTMLQNGNVGIGTSTPLAKLGVVGTAGDNDVLDIASSTGASLLRVRANGNVGIGTSTPTEKLSVVGNISNITSPSTTITQISTTSVGLAPYSIFVSGRYAYVTNKDADTISVLDISNPASSTQIATTSVGSGPRSIFVSGRYAYVANSLANNISVVDISNPKTPRQIATASVDPSPDSIYVSGRYAYTANFISSTISVVDVSNPLAPTQIATTSVDTGPIAIFVLGRYAYVANSTSNTISVVDISNPSAPVQIATTSVVINPEAIYVSGRYAYTANIGSDNMSVIDISNPLAPTQVAIVTVGATPRAIFVSGRYAYTANTGGNTISVIDISNPTIPRLITTANVSTFPRAIFVSGRYAYVGNETADSISIVDISGTEVSSLMAHSAEVGNIQSRNDIFAQGNIMAGTSLLVGSGGIQSQGSLSVFASSTGSASSIFSISSAQRQNILTVFADGNIGVGTSTPEAKLHIVTTTEQLRLGYDGTNYASFTVGSNGTLTIDAAGSVTTSISDKLSVLSNSYFGTIASGTWNGAIIGIAYGGTNSSTIGPAGSVAYSNGSAYYFTAVGNTGELLKSNGADAPTWISTSSLGLGGTSQWTTSGANIYYVGGVGINTTSVSSTLFVQGTATTTPFDIVSTTGRSLLRVLQNGNVGIGTSTPSEKLQVVGNISNLTTPNTTISLVTTTGAGSNSYAIFVSGKYAYTANWGNNTMSIFDVSNSISPKLITSTAVAGSPRSIYVSGRYAYVGNSGNNNISIVDISNPFAAKQVTTTLVGAGPRGIYVSGKYAYTANFTGDSISVVDISNPIAAMQVATTSVGDDPSSIYVSGKYAYVANQTGNSISVVDISNPSAPTQVATTSVGNGPASVYVSGRYAYTANASVNSVSIIDISNPLAPTTTVTLTGFSSPNSIFVSGRYAYVSNSGASNVVIVDISSSSAPFIVTNGSATSPISIYVSGRYVYAANSAAAGGFSILDISGTEVSSLIAHSAEVGNIQSRNDIFAQGNIMAGTSLLVGVGGIMSNGALSVFASSTAATSSIFSIDSAQTASIFKVLANGNVGINSSSPLASLTVRGQTGSDIFSFNSSTGASVFSLKQDGNLYTGNTSFQMYSGDQTSYIGFTNSAGVIISGVGAKLLLAGASPYIRPYSQGYGIGMRGNFALVTAGIASFIGSEDPRENTSGTSTQAQVQGFFNPQSGSGDFIGLDVGVVASTSVSYSGGQFTALRVSPVLRSVSGTTRTLLMDVGTNATASAGGSATGAHTSLFVIDSTGKVGIGTSTPTEKLSVVGNISNITSASTTISQITTVSVETGPRGVFVSGQYAYVVNADSNSISIINISKPSSPVQISTTSVGTSPRSVYVSGRYAYVANFVSSSISVVDISNPFTPKEVATAATGATPISIFVSGKYAYTANYNASNVSVIDISNPTAPSEISTVAVEKNPAGIYVSGRYAYITNYASNTISVVDVSNPSVPVQVSTTSVGVNPRGIYVSGRYAYVTNEGANTISVIDISNASAPSQIATLSVGNGPFSIYVSGRYAYVVNNSIVSNSISIVDVSTPSAPVQIMTTAVGSAPAGIYVSGRYAYVSNFDSNTISVVDISGTEVTSLIAHSAEVGNIQSRNDIFAQGNIMAGTGLIVGTGGIQSQGALSVFSSSTGAASIFDVSSIASSSVFKVLANGKVLINTTTVFGSNSYALYVDSRGGPTGYGIGVEGRIQASGIVTSGTLDIAESYFVEPSCAASGTCPESGDVVCAAPGADATIRKCSAYGDEKTIGIISTNPGLYLGNAPEGNTSTRMVALAGRVPVKVSTANGNISVGDKLAPSDMPGIAVKATSEGPTIGIAMADYSDEEMGRVLTFVSLGWKNTLYRDLTVSVSSGTISVGSLASPYDLALSKNLIFNNTDAINKISFATSTLFESSLSPFIGASAFTFNAGGFTSPNADNYIISVRANNNPVFSVAANGDVHAAGSYFGASAVLGTSTNPGDLAERVDIAIDDNAEAGDVMIVDKNAPDTYRRSISAHEQAVAGVISTNPTIVVGNGKTDYTAVLAMVGRVPVKVSNENGNIQRGDLLITASATGHAMKYDPAKDSSSKMVAVIGVALEPLNSSTGKILSLIRTGWIYNRDSAIGNIQNNITQLAVAQGLNLNPSSTPENLNIASSGGQLVYAGGNLDLQNNLVVNVAGIVGKDNKWRIDEWGNITQKIATAKGDKEVYGLQSTGKQEVVISGTSTLENGYKKVLLTELDQEIIDKSVPLKVSITMSGETKGVYVAEKNYDSFVVKENESGQSNAEFDWIAIAKILSADAPLVVAPVEEIQASEPLIPEILETPSPVAETLPTTLEVPTDFATTTEVGSNEVSSSSVALP